MSHDRKFKEGSRGQVVYEITARMEPELAEEFTAFMVEKHVPDLLATGHFASATVVQSNRTLRISYIALSSEDLRAYLEKHAPRLRAEVVERFPNGLQIERTEWNVVAVLAPR